MIEKLQKLEDDPSLTKSEELALFEDALTKHIITTAAKDLHKGQITAPVKAVLKPYIEAYLDGQLLEDLKNLPERKRRLQS